MTLGTFPGPPHLANVAPSAHLREARWRRLGGVPQMAESGDTGQQAGGHSSGEKPEALAAAGGHRVVWNGSLVSGLGLTSLGVTLIISRVRGLSSVRGPDTCFISPLLALTFWDPFYTLTQGAFPVGTSQGGRPEPQVSSIQVFQMLLDKALERSP